MKPLSLEVDSKDTKRVNLPIGRVLVPELVAVVNSPILIQKKKMVDSALNEMAEKALDDMLKEIDMNKKSVVQFIENMRRERAEYSSRFVPPIKRVNANVIEQQEDEEEDVLHQKHFDIHLEPISMHKFDHMLVQLEKSFGKTNDIGRRIAYLYMRQALRVMEENPLSRHGQ